MTTVFTSLTFYDTLIKQDRLRSHAVIPVICPRTQLPPFLISVGAYTVATINSIKLVSCTGSETTITGYFSVLPTVTASTATSGLGTYVKYNGAAMSTPLPIGSYYVKITKSDITYYSDWIYIQTIPSPMLKFIKITFSNSDNLGNIRYEDSFTQAVWLEAILNDPTHETVNIGEEKDGIFIAEKIVTKFIYVVIAYVSRAMYNCLIRLPQHDTITITDEVGNTYTPAIGNIIVEPGEWNYYDVCRIVIKFNDGANSSYVWTK